VESMAAALEAEEQRIRRGRADSGSSGGRGGAGARLGCRRGVHGSSVGGRGAKDSTRPCGETTRPCREVAFARTPHARSAPARDCPSSPPARTVAPPRPCSHTQPNPPTHPPRLPLSWAHGRRSRPAAAATAPSRSDTNPRRHRSPQGMETEAVAEESGELIERPPPCLRRQILKIDCPRQGRSSGGSTEP
jgi:hypothetical protein